MWIWRITRAVHAALDGEGARLYGGRWTPKGLPAAYCSATLSLAALERFVQTGSDDDTPDLVAVAIDVPDELASESLNPAQLPSDWRQYPAPVGLARVGEKWLRTGRTPLLTVPSVIVPRERNYIINPAHPDARRIVVAMREPFSFDPRMWGRPAPKKPRRA